MTALTAEMIADLRVVRDLQIAPDGARLVYSLAPAGKRDEHATSALWLAPVDGSAPPRQFTAGTANDHAPRWSPDGTQIAFLSDRGTRGTDQLYVIMADGGEARALTAITNKNPVQSFAWSPGGGHLVFTSADEPTEDDARREKERDDADVFGARWPYARLRLLSVATGEISTLVGGQQHVAEMAWSPRGTEIAYCAWQTPALESRDHETIIAHVALAGGDPRIVCRFPCAVDSIQWPSDGERLLFQAPVAVKSQSSRAVYGVAATGGEPRQLALGDDRCAAGLYQPPGSARLLVGVGVGLETHVCWLDSTTGALDPLFTVGSPDDRAGLSSWTACVVPGGETVMGMVRSAGDQPWEVWAAGPNRAGKTPSWQQVSAHHQELAGITWGRQEPFFWTAPDGLELDGVLVRPTGDAAASPVPTVVLVHGGPYGRWELGWHVGWADWAQWLALAGYAVLLPNPRGGFGHGESFAAAARGDVGGADYGDVMAAVDIAVARGIADPERLGIAGWSQGGFMTAWAVTQSTRFKAGVMGAGVSDWGMMVMTSDVPDFERELGGSAPWDGTGPHRHTALSPITFASAVTTPMLILHGQNDARVPLSQAIGFHRALRERQVASELVVYPREPHAISERAHQIDLLRRVRSWYDRWLWPRPSSGQDDQPCPRTTVVGQAGSRSA
jgi:dipeptidyl aminopeptidase/acylaminoacyl peptidase